MHIREKLIAYCDINTILSPERFTSFLEHQEKKDASGAFLFHTLQAYNTEHFLVEGLREYTRGSIDEETFFHIGDITSDRPIKRVRPHLDAVFFITHHIKPYTLYVVDESAMIVYQHATHDKGEFHELLEQSHCAIVAISLPPVVLF